MAEIEGNVVELWTRPGAQADPVMVGLLANGFSEQQARWHAERFYELMRDVPSVHVTIPNCTEDQREPIESATAQIKAMQTAYRELVHFLLRDLYTAIWPPNPGGGSRKAA